MKYTVDELNGAIITTSIDNKYLLQKGTKHGYLNYIDTCDNQVYRDWNTANYISNLITSGEYIVNFPNNKKPIKYEVYN